MTDDSRRPWFGGKRVGYGIRPQTWQGWLVSLVVVVVIVGIILLVDR
jgi:ABC-type dipeptide/oligopeptide/nickel transport system permease subunit